MWLSIFLAAVSGVLAAILTPIVTQAGERRQARAAFIEALYEADGAWGPERQDSEGVGYSERLPKVLAKLEVRAVAARIPRSLLSRYQAALVDMFAHAGQHSRTGHWHAPSAQQSELAAAREKLSVAIWHPWRAAGADRLRWILAHATRSRGASKPA